MLDKLINSVLLNWLFFDFLTQVLDDVTSWQHFSVCKIVNSCNQNLFLLIDKTLMSERVNFLLELDETAHALKQHIRVAVILFSCRTETGKLLSLNCSNCVVNSLRFGVFIAHFVMMMKTCLVCFDADCVLMQNLSYLTFIFLGQRVLFLLGKKKDCLF